MVGWASGPSFEDSSHEAVSVPLGVQEHCVGRPRRRVEKGGLEFSLLDFVFDRGKLTGWKPIPPKKGKLTGWKPILPKRWGFDGRTGILPVIL